MPRYEYLCRDCGSTFEQQRAMTEAEGDVRCPEGHDPVRRRFTVHALSMSGPGSLGSDAPAPTMGSGGGCCGGGCGCR